MLRVSFGSPLWAQHCPSVRVTPGARYSFCCGCMSSCGGAGFWLMLSQCVTRPPAAPVCHCGATAGQEVLWDRWIHSRAHRGRQCQATKSSQLGLGAAGDGRTSLPWGAVLMPL